MQQIQGSLLSIANTQDGSGNYIFAGYSTQTQPFAQSATGATYSGDQGQRQVQIGAGQTVVVGDNGDLVFNQIKTGQRHFQRHPGGAATRAVASSAQPRVGDAAAYDGGAYAINFVTPTTYQVVDSATAAVVASGTYTSGQAINFAGLNSHPVGSAGRGRFVRRGGEHQSKPVHHGAEPRERPAAKQHERRLGGAAQQLDRERHQQHRSGARSGADGPVERRCAPQHHHHRSSRLRRLRQTQLTQSITTLQGLDYASAITSLDSQNTTLSAAMQAFTPDPGSVAVQVSVDGATGHIRGQPRRSGGRRRAAGTHLRHTSGAAAARRVHSRRCARSGTRRSSPTADRVHEEFERKLCEYLGVKHIALFANCTIGLVTALQALRITGEVITTPYSFVGDGAFAVVERHQARVRRHRSGQTFNLDPRRIEAAITPQTTAIMPVHCYGHPCDVDRIQAIADNYGLKVIYDAAHGVRRESATAAACCRTAICRC